MPRLPSKALPNKAMPASDPSSELGRETGLFLDSLARANFSPYTLRSYRSDLDQFVTYCAPPGEHPPAPAAIDPLLIREFMADCFERGNSNRSVSRKLSALRAFFKFLVREGQVATNPAKLVSMPKTPQTLPAVMTPDEANTLTISIATSAGSACAARDARNGSSPLAGAPPKLWTRIYKSAAMGSSRR